MLKPWRRNLRLLDCALPPFFALGEKLVSEIPANTKQQRTLKAIQFCAVII